MPHHPAPIVTAILPAYQAADTLARAVGSVQAQTRTDWELLVVDDGSRDSTAVIAQGLAEADARISVLHQPANSGAAAARNRAIRAARGRYIAFLDADDTWEPDKLARQIGFMQTHGHALSYTGFWRISGKKRRAVVPPSQVDYATLLRGNVIGCLTAVYDRDQLGRAEMPDLPTRQDFAFWLALLKRIPAAHGLPAPLASHYRRPGSLSSNRLKALAGTWHMYRRAEGLSVPASAWFLGHHLAGRLRRG